MLKNNPFPQPISEQIWQSKYRLVTPNPDIPNDESVQDTWKRIATACGKSDPHIYPNARNKENPQVAEKRRTIDFLDALDDFKFLTAGRITSGAGAGRQVTLFNCYVMGTIPDSMSGIFDMLKEAALTMQQGGGIGYDFSPLRPRNSPVKGVDSDASGPITFMDVWDSMCRTIMSAGSRRGAMMATMACDHPDVVEFIKAKKDKARLRMFNVSVLASDEFMERVKNDEEWPLMHKVPPEEPVTWNNVTSINGKHIYSVIKARDLWKMMMENTYHYAEPGVIFIDRINRFNNLWYCEKISSTNPCGEQPLPPYGACLLGSINLAKMVKNPFQEGAMIDIPLLKKTARQAVRILDSVIDISLFPIPEQRAEAMAKRRMGIGITGLADMLAMVRLTYGTDEAAAFAKEVMYIITTEAYRESIELAKIYGPCPVTAKTGDRQKFIQSEFMKGMPGDIRNGVIINGIRNALLTSIAPTGTISLYAGNVSSGVEPIFAYTYTRKVLEKDGITKREEIVDDYGVHLYREMWENGDFGMFPDASFDPKKHLPKHFVTAQTLTPHDHLVMQAAIQCWVDSSISKTINCPEDITFEDFEEIYLTAYDMGCKGCTTYRPNDVTGSVLSVEPEEKEKAPEVFDVEGPPVSTEKVMLDTAMVRPKVIDGQTYKLLWQEKNVYVTINNHVDPNGYHIPFEIFINSKEMNHFQWTVALTRMISSVFRRGGDVSFIIDDLRSIFDPNGGEFVSGLGYVPSFIALLGLTIQEHLDSLSSIKKQDQQVKEDSIADADPVLAAMITHRPVQCPNCLGFNVQVASGCPTCLDCAHSKCG